MQSSKHFPLAQNVKLLVILLVLGLVIGISTSAQIPVASAATGCSTSGPTSGAYTVTVCITAPADGSTLTGATTVTTSVSVTGTNPGVQQTVYTLDSQYLLTDYASPYSYTLPTQQFVDGTRLLQAQAVMRDGYSTSLAGVSLTFSNGVTTPPVNNNTFTPAAGTTPQPGSPYILAAVGDGASGEPSEGNVVNLISSWNPNMFLYLGDVYEKGGLVEFSNWYAPTNFYGKFQAITNPTVGNHEYSTAAAAGYFDYWNNVAHYYSFNANGWHFISLDSTSQYNQTDPTTAQYQWLAQDLAAHPGVCTIAYFHHPVYNVGPEGDTPRMDAIWSLLAQSGVALVLNGHDHDYQRWVPLDGAGNPSPTGVTEIVAGTGGHGIQQFIRTDSRLAFGYDQNITGFGGLRLQLNATGATFAYINTQGTVLDSGVVPCNAAAPDTTPPTTPTGLAATSSNPGNVSLTWNASTDNTGVAGYTVYRNGAALATVAGGTLNYADATAAPATTYSYAVDAFDPAGNHSAPSSPVSVTTGSSYTFGPVADAYVNQSNPTTNYGSATALREDASPDLHAYLRFNVQSVAGSIGQATLRIYNNSSSSLGYQVRGVSDNTWTESTINYSNAPAYSSVATASSGAVTAGTWSSLDITALVTGNGSLNLALTTTSATTISDASRESGATAPQLIIQVSQAPTPTNTPLPPTPTNTAAPAATATNTPLPATATATNTPLPPTATSTPLLSTPTNTTPPPTATNTPLPPTPTNTPLPPTPTNTPLPPTPTNTPLPPTPTNTSLPPTPTNTPLPPTATTTPLPPTPTNTPPPPTPTATSTPSTKTTTFTPAADAYVYQSNPTTNYGSSTSLRADGSPIMNSYVKFNVQSLSGTIKSVTLRIYANSSSSAGYAARGVADSTWGETTITYSNAPAMSSTITGSSGSFATGAWTAVNVAALVTGNGTYSFGLTTTGAQINLASRESGANAPQLVIVTQ